MENYVVKSNRESGTGRTDLFVRHASIFEPAYIFEFKVAKTGAELKTKAEEALQQIHDRGYDAELRDAGYTDITCYGVSFFRKDCFVVVE